MLWRHATARSIWLWVYVMRRFLLYFSFKSNDMNNVELRYILAKILYIYRFKFQQSIWDLRYFICFQIWPISKIYVSYIHEPIRTFCEPARTESSIWSNRIIYTILYLKVCLIPIHFNMFTKASWYKTDVRLKRILVSGYPEFNYIFRRTWSLGV